MRSILLTLGFVLIIGNGYAQVSLSPPKDSVIAPWYVDRFRISAGGFVPIIDTDIQVGVKGGEDGTNVDLEKDLGFNSSEFTFFAGAQWRISRRSQLNFSFYDVRRTAYHVLEDDIEFKGHTYPVNSKVNSFFNTAIYQISFSYAIVAKPRYEIGIMAGTHLVGGQTGIALDDAGAGVSSSDNFGFTAPLPDLGIWGGYAISKRLAITLDVDYLSLTIDDTQGSIFAYNLIVLYRLVKKLDVALGFSGLNFSANKAQDNYQAYFKWGYNGPSLGIAYSFGKTSWKH